MLETYADKHLDAIEEVLKDYTSRLVILVGAEDYGIPLNEIKKLPHPRHIVRIPVSVQGTSYNVVVATVIALYEITRAFSKKSPTTRMETSLYDKA